MTFPVVLAGSACLHCASFLSKQQCKKLFSYDHVDTALSRKGFSFLQCSSTLNQITFHLCHHMRHEELEWGMKENLLNNTELFSKIQLYYFKTELK